MSDQVTEGQMNDILGMLDGSKGSINMGEEEVAQVEEPNSELEVDLLSEDTVEADSETEETPDLSTEGEVSEDGLSLDSGDSADQSTELPDIEELSVKGLPGGGRKTIKVDYSDREAIKKAYLKAAGMDKFRKERDSYKKELEEIKAGNDANLEDFRKLNEAFEKDGVKGLIKLLKADSELDTILEERAQEREYLANLTAEERAKLERQKLNEEWEAKFNAEKEARESIVRRTQEQEEASAAKELQSLLAPSFERYRMQGKLGNPALENTLDNAIFTEARNRLQEIPEDVELTQAVVNKVFRTVAAEHSKGFSDHLKQTTKKVVEKKKQQTGKAIRSQAKRGSGAKSPAQTARELAAKGDLVGAIAALRG